MNRIGLSLQIYISEPDRMAEWVFSGGGLQAHTAPVMYFASAAALWLALPCLFALGVAFLQGALVLSGQKLQPKLSRISPLKNAKQKFGADGLFNFANSSLKLVVFSTALALVFQSELEEILAMSALPLPEMLQLTADLCFRFLVVSAAATLVIAAIDFFWQRSQFLRRQRMSLKELRDELKETDGDPHTKQSRRQRAQEIATNQMLAEVPRADVVVVHPEHFAVALQWERKRGTAPVCVAKGLDEIAMRIRELAMEHAVPIYHDPPTARAVYSVVSVGEEISGEHYQAIAAAIRFSDTMREKARWGR